jgi:hypothetical protein
MLMRKARQPFDPHPTRALFRPLPQGAACAHAAKRRQRMDDAVKGGEITCPTKQQGCSAMDRAGAKVNGGCIQR